ncbi:uncharacterized protein LOC143595654 [Bidens hawaiensis]|uniref:uncharacterized protein LOC143595654 n=1 Tax=Bidens hawaiensis TaxID=980011 RepID=UPI004049D1AA
MELDDGDGLHQEVKEPLVESTCNDDTHDAELREQGNRVEDVSASVTDIETTKPLIIINELQVDSHKLVQVDTTVISCDGNDLNSSQEDAGEDDGLEEEHKGNQPLAESWNNEDTKLRDEIRVVDTVEDDHDTVGPRNKNEEHVCHKVVLANENNLSSRQVYTLDLADKDERTIKFGETAVTKTDGSEYTVLRAIEERLIHSVEDAARAIGDETLLDERKTNNLESLEVGYEVKENNIADDNVDAFARSPPSERDTDSGNKVKENAGDDDDDVNALACSPSKHDTVNAEVVCKTITSREENLDVDDEKIWEKIRAMKTIVGYNAPSQSTCIGELKALYVFTGVEPPASFEGDSDLDAKLKFLMAIVGVK